MVQLPPNFFFWKKLLISFSSTYWPLSFCKILKKLLEPIQSYEDVPFSGPKYPNLSWAKFFGTNHYYYYHLPIGPFHWAKFKKNSYSRSKVMRMRNFWAQNGPFPWMRIFLSKPVNEPCFFHSYLSTCQKSKSNIYLLVKYWQLKNTEISLGENNFWL